MANSHPSLCLRITRLRKLVGKLSSFGGFAPRPCATMTFPSHGASQGTHPGSADFPKPGINFYDITTLMKDAKGLRKVIDAFHTHYKDDRIDVVVGIEARGYFFAPAVALALGTGFVPVRKPKKLPCEVEFWEYELEYGTDRLEIHKDAIENGQRVLIVDDVLATGGTAAAVARLVEKLGGISPAMAS